MLTYMGAVCVTDLPRYYMWKNYKVSYKNLHYMVYFQAVSGYYDVPVSLLLFHLFGSRAQYGAQDFTQ